jgi:hypothetical protein
MSGEPTRPAYRSADLVAFATALFRRATRGMRNS